MMQLRFTEGEWRTRDLKLCLPIECKRGSREKLISFSDEHFDFWNAHKKYVPQHANEMCINYRGHCNTPYPLSGPKNKWKQQLSSRFLLVQRAAAVHGAMWAVSNSTGLKKLRSHGQSIALTFGGFVSWSETIQEPILLRLSPAYGTSLAWKILLTRKA